MSRRIMLSAFWVAIGLCAAVLYGWGYHAGAAMGMAKAAAAQAQVAALSATVEQATAAARQAKRQAAAQREMAQALLQDQNKRRAAYAKRMAALDARLKRAAADPGCAVLKETLCAAISAY